MKKSVDDKAATGRPFSCRAKRCRTMSAVPQAPLRLSLLAGFLEKREKGRTPSYSVKMLKDRPPFYVPVKVADPSLLRSGPVLCAVIYAQDLQILILNAIDNDVR